MTSSFQTREELRECLENEMRAFLVDKELGAKCVIGWNHKEFEVPYICLSDEIKIGKGGFQIKINFLVDKEMGQYVCRILGKTRFSFHEK